MDGCGLVLMCQSIPLHATNPSKLRSRQYIMYFCETEAVWGTRRATFYGPDRKGKSPTVNTPEALPAILGGGARAFRSIPIAACSDEDRLHWNPIILPTKK